MVNLQRTLAVALLFSLAGCGLVTSDQINRTQNAADLTRFDDFEICNPLVKTTPLVEQERKRRNLPPCEQYRKEVDEGKRPDPTRKYMDWLMLLLMLAAPAGA